MPFNSPRSAAEASDSLANLTAAAAGVAAIIYSVNVIETFASSTLVDIAGYGQKALGIAVLVVYLPSLLYLKSRGGRAEGKHSAGGFLNAMMRKAAITAFHLTIGFLIVLSLMDRVLLSHFTAKSIVDLITGFSLAAFAVSFFILNRFSEGNGIDE